MLREELQNINKEYKTLKSLENQVLFEHNKKKILFSMIVMPFISFFIFLLSSFMFIIEAPMLIKLGFNSYFIYSSMAIISFIFIFYTIAISYSGWFFFIKYLLCKKKSKEIMSFEEYNLLINKKKEDAIKILHKLKEQSSKQKGLEMNKTKFNKDFKEKMKDRMKQIGKPFSKVKCLSGATINYKDKIRVFILVENLVLQTQESMQNNHNYFKIIGLPFQATYEGGFDFEANIDSAEYKITSGFLHDIFKKETDIQELSKEIQNKDVTPIVYQTKAGISYCFMREDVYKKTQEMESYSFYGRSFNVLEKNMISIFKRIASIQLDEKRKSGNKELDDFNLDYLRSDYADENVRSLSNFFFKAPFLFSRSLGKNQHNLIRAFHAVNVLDINSMTIEPVKETSSKNLSMLQCIQKANLKEVDYELNELDIDYESETMLVVTVSDIREGSKLVYSSKKTTPNDVGGVDINFEEKDYIVKKENKLFPLNKCFVGQFDLMKVINK